MFTADLSLHQLDQLGANCADSERLGVGDEHIVAGRRGAIITAAGLEEGKEIVDAVVARNNLPQAIEHVALRLVVLKDGGKECMEELDLLDNVIGRADLLHQRNRFVPPPQTQKKTHRRGCFFDAHKQGRDRLDRAIRVGPRRYDGWEGRDHGLKKKKIFFFGGGGGGGGG